MKRQVPGLPADEIAPRLWMGSRPVRPLPPQPQFTMVVLAALEYQPPAEAFPPLKVLRVPLDDGVLSTQEMVMVRVAGEEVAAEIRRGGRVLVTCSMGVNRSGLVLARALFELGATPGSIISVIKSRRRVLGGALRNENFVAYIKSWSGENERSIAEALRRRPIH